MRTKVIIQIIYTDKITAIETPISVIKMTKGYGSDGTYRLDASVLPTDRGKRCFWIINPQGCWMETRSRYIRRLRRRVPQPTVAVFVSNLLLPFFWWWKLMAVAKRKLADASLLGLLTANLILLSKSYASAPPRHETLLPHNCELNNNAVVSYCDRQRTVFIKTVLEGWCNSKLWITIIENFIGLFWYQGHRPVYW